MKLTHFTIFAACVCGSSAAAVPLAGLECDVEKFAANRLANVQTTLFGFEDYFVKAFENDVKKAMKDAKEAWEKDGLCRGVNAEHAYRHAHELMEEVRTKAYSELERESVVFAPRGDEMIIRDIHRKSCMWNEEETQKALQAAEVARIEWYKTLALFYDHEFSALRVELLTFSAKYVASGKCTMADKVNSQWGAWYPQDRFQGFKDDWAEGGKFRRFAQGYGQQFSWDCPRSLLFTVYLCMLFENAIEYSQPFPFLLNTV